MEEGETGRSHAVRGWILRKRGGPLLPYLAMDFPGMPGVNGRGGRGTKAGN
jgi:hypothetical protein